LIGLIPAKLNISWVKFAPTALCSTDKQRLSGAGASVESTEALIIHVVGDGG
jgi:hypothetical protein